MTRRQSSSLHWRDFVWVAKVIFVHKPRASYFWFIEARLLSGTQMYVWHEDVMAWGRFPHYWPFVRGIQGSPPLMKWGVTWLDKGILVMRLQIVIQHYNDVMMSAMVSPITGVSTVCWTVCSGADQRKHQSSASLAFMRVTGGFPSQRSVTRKMFPFDDVIMSLIDITI